MFGKKKKANEIKKEEVIEEPTTTITTGNSNDSEETQPIPTPVPTTPPLPPPSIEGPTKLTDEEKADMIELIGVLENSTYFKLYSEVLQGQREYNLHSKLTSLLE